jgi:hypothetical protein
MVTWLRPARVTNCGRSTTSGTVTGAIAMVYGAAVAAVVIAGFGNGSRVNV